VRVAEREGIHADTVPRPVRDDAIQGSTASVLHSFSGSAGRVTEREGFMQTRCHGQSVTKLVRALQLQRNAGRVAEREGFLQTRCHGQSVTKLVRAPKLQRKRRQGGRAAQLDSGASRLDNNSRRGLMQRALEPGETCLT
jgi:hypothetical protein